jgi:Toastrack DUF4097
MLRTKLALTTFALAAAPLVAGAQHVVGRDGSNFDWSDQIAKGAWFRVVSPNGAITVTRGTGDKVEVHAEKVLRGGKDSDVGFLVVKEGGDIALCAVYDDDDDCSIDGRGRYSRSHDWGSWRHQPKINITVRLPEGVNIRAGSGNGDVSVSGAGETVASTGNGKVRVSAAGGSVDASSGNGVISVDGAQGPVTASTGNGDVTVATTLGPVTASSGNGDIEVSMDRLTSDRDMTFSTGNGRVTITVPADFAADVETDTGNGSFESDFPIQMHGRISPSHIRGTIGSASGGRRLRVSTGNGTIDPQEGLVGRRRYSRSTVAGFTRLARHAGTSAATSATSRIPSDARAGVAGSAAVTR